MLFSLKEVTRRLRKWKYSTKKVSFWAIFNANYIALYSFLLCFCNHKSLKINNFFSLFWAYNTPTPFLSSANFYWKHLNKCHEQKNTLHALNLCTNNLDHWQIWFIFHAFSSSYFSSIANVRAAFSSLFYSFKEFICWQCWCDINSLLFHINFNLVDSPWYKQN